MRITKFIEKPTVKCAEKELAMRDGSDVASYYSVFGQYILTPEVFEVLERNIQEEESESGEIGMTEALVQFIDNGLTGLVIDGKMHDIGNVAAYRETVMGFGEAI
jgi:UTP-glucose-1-phosphate uridylyltransferase